MLSFYLSFLLKYILKPHQMSDHDQYTKTYYNIYIFFNENHFLLEWHVLCDFFWHHLFLSSCLSIARFLNH